MCSSAVERVGAVLFVKRVSGISQVVPQTACPRVPPQGSFSSGDALNLLHSQCWTKPHVVQRSVASNKVRLFIYPSLCVRNNRTAFQYNQMQSTYSLVLTSLQIDRQCLLSFGTNEFLYTLAYLYFVITYFQTTNK